MNTTCTTIVEFARMVAEFRRAKLVFETTRAGSKRGDAAERTMEALVERAEHCGFLSAFVAGVTNGGGMPKSPYQKHSTTRDTDIANIEERIFEIAMETAYTNNTERLAALNAILASLCAAHESLTQQ